jgi:hypothetical protein
MTWIQQHTSLCVLEACFVSLFIEINKTRISPQRQKRPFNFFSTSNRNWSSHYSAFGLSVIGQIFSTTLGRCRWRATKREIQRSGQRQADLTTRWNHDGLVSNKGLEAVLQKKPAPYYKERTFTHTIILHYPLIHSQSITIPEGNHKTDWENQLHWAMRARD